MKANLFIKWSIGIVCSICFVLLLFYVQRSNFYEVIVLYAILFTAYWYVIVKKEIFTTKQLVGFGIAVRCIAIFSLPNFSDDYFRFVWDGHLLNNGTNPFSVLPIDYLQQHPSGYLQTVFNGLNSPKYFSVYPPLLQSIFSLANFISPTNIHGAVMVMKVFVVAAEIGTIIFLQRYLAFLQNDNVHQSLRKSSQQNDINKNLKYTFPKRNILLYAINPLIIIELSGNLHFEAFMIFGMVACLYFFQKQQVYKSALYFAIAVGAKLIPLIFLPLFLKQLGFKKFIPFAIIVCLLPALSFIAFYEPNLFQNISSSFSLYFKNFEFNASIYYFIRWIGFQVKGYNIIQQAAPFISLATLAFILAIAFLSSKMQSIAAKMLFTLSIYVLFSTIVHPWYALPLVAFAVVTNYRFAIVFSMFLPLSYYAYSQQLIKENLWLVGVEYFVVISFLLYELSKKKIIN